jgi:hypothetical protein
MDHDLDSIKLNIPIFQDKNNPKTGLDFLLP